MINDQTSAIVVRGTPIQTVVKDDEWQVVRKAMVGNWVNNHEYNVATLRAYLDKHLWSPAATRRVLNVLVGTVHRVGHTMGQASTDQLRLEVRIHWAKFFDEPTDDIIGPITQWNNEKRTFA